MSRIRATCLVLTACLLPALAPTPVFAGSTLKTITPGQLTVAYRTDDKPVSFIKDGKPAGFIVDFERAIGARLGLKVEFVSTNFASMLPGVRNNRYDTAAFGVLETPKRLKVVNFTTPVGYGQARLVSRTASPIAKVDGAKGKTVAITRGSALIPLINRIAPGVKVKEFPNIAASLNALIAKQVDGLFTGLATADRLVHSHPGLVASQMVTSGIDGFPVAKTNPELLAALNKAIASLMKDGTFTRLFVQWNPASVKIPEQLYADYPGMPRPAGDSAGPTPAKK
jgi:polar amino acid transport system substrate-binding protein